MADQDSSKTGLPLHVSGTSPHKIVEKQSIERFPARDCSPKVSPSAGCLFHARYHSTRRRGSIS